MDDSKLRQYFKFDETDLQANRTGQLSEKQKARLDAEAQYNNKWNRIGGLGFLLITALGLIGLMAVSHGFNRAALLGFGFFWLATWGGLALRLFRLTSVGREINLANVHGQAKVVETKHYNVNTKKHTTRHELQIGGKRFSAITLLAEIMPGSSYTIYFIDRALEHPADTSYLYSSADILSAEEGS
jgi:hypothetical protein